MLAKSQTTVARTASAVSCAVARLALRLSLNAHQTYRSAPIIMTVRGSCQFERLPPGTRLALMIWTPTEAARREA